MLKAMLRLLWRRDSDSAQSVCIEAAEHMTLSELRDMRDYFAAVLDHRVKVIADSFEPCDSLIRNVDHYEERKDNE